jgi:hypothetical protein
MASLTRIHDADTHCVCRTSGVMVGQDLVTMPCVIQIAWFCEVWQVVERLSTAPRPTARPDPGPSPGHLPAAVPVAYNLYWDTGDSSFQPR